MKICLGVVALIVFSLSSCHAVRGSKFVVLNKTQRELKDIEIAFGDASVNVQSLGPGKTFSFRPSPKRDGAISISYTENGRKKSHEVGYVAPPFTMKCEFAITDADILGDCQ